MASKKIKESEGYLTFQIINTIIMIFVCLVTLYPFWYLIAQSFSSEQAIIQGKVTIFPVDFNLTTYISVIKQGDFLKFYGNTVVYSVIGTALSIFFSACLAYPLSKPQLRLNKFLTPFVIFTM